MSEIRKAFIIISIERNSLTFFFIVKNYLSLVRKVTL